jgi:class 3 adenylate cyclase/tetratricopeptide (TPR) repeat protein
MVACPACGFENAETAKFCAECGTPLAQAPVARREERKVVTVVFADMVGSTERAERLDPEDVRALLAPYHERLRHELERHGGTVEKFIGDAVVAVFGAPVAHEDDAERGVRAALAIQEAIAEMNEADPALALEVRIGVNTGESLVALDARPELGEGIVSGDVVNTGARLQSAAPPGGVLVGEYTFRATERAIEYEEHDPVAAKGKSEPVSAWLALRRRASFGIDLDAPAYAPLVGRDRELDALADALSRVRERLEPELVTLVGVPGIGKSRLVQELMQVVDADADLITWRQGRSLPYGEGVALWSLGEIVKAQAGILESDGAEETGEKLAAMIGSLIADEADARWVERHLRRLTGIHDPAALAESAQEGFAAWRRFVEALAEWRPTVLVFEDLHWADEGLLDFVDALAERVTGVPLLVVCSARPELLERRPGWGGGKRNATTVSLVPLSDEDTTRLLGALLGSSVLLADTQLELLRRAGGIPLFAEEYARMQQAGAVREVPATLNGIVTARIDGLPPLEKELLQGAAILGKVFWTDVLAELAGVEPGSLEDLLFALERKEFVRRERRSAIAGARQYAFVHALVRDAAYGQVPRAKRSNLHRRAAEWIERLPPDRSEDRAEMLAHHLSAAVELGRAAGLDVSQIAPAAADAARAAGDRSWALGAPQAALASYERARSLDPSAAADPNLLLRIGRALLVVHGKGDEELDQAAAGLAETDPAAAAEAVLLRGEAVWQRGDQSAAFSYFERASTMVEGLPVGYRKALVTSQVARFSALAGRTDEGLELAGKAIEMAHELGDDELLSDSLNTRGVARSALGDRDSLADIEESLRLGRALNSFRAGRAYTNLASELAATYGDVRRADATLREGIEFVDRLGSHLQLRWLQGNLAETSYHLGHWDEALELAEQDLANPEPHYMQQLCRMVRAWIRLARDDDAGALEDIELALREAHQIRDPQVLVPGLTAHAFWASIIGERAVAEASLDELEAVLAQIGSMASGVAGGWVVQLAFTLLELGREQEIVDLDLGAATAWSDVAHAIASDELVAAADLLAVTGSVAWAADARLWAARRLSGRGLHAEAQAQLASALAFHRLVGASRAVREGEALLAAAS